jgi:predicted PurR-regulated permease PerM
MAAGPQQPRRDRVRFSARSVVVAVAMFGATITLLGVAAASRRVIGWILVAGVVAALLHPTVSFLERRFKRRGLAVLAVMLLLLGAAASVLYGTVDDIRRETRRLQEVAPDRARLLERSPRFGRLARDFELEERTRRFVDEVPERLRGGTPAEALRAAGTRGVAFLATTVLTIFFLLHGPRIARSATGQIRNETHRGRLRAVALSVYRRSFGYASATLVMAIASGLFGYAAARAADVPGAAALGIWTGLWDLVPGVGAFVGALPIIVLAAVVSGERAAVLTVAFLTYQALENRFVQRPVERATVRIGPFLTLAGGLVGLELSGLAGALLVVLAVVLAVVTAEELQGSIDGAGVPSETAPPSIQEDGTPTQEGSL